MDAYAGRIWNVGGGTVNSVSLREATELSREVTGKKIQVTPTDENRPSDLKLYITDHRAVSAVRGWTPRRDARRTFGDIAEWIHGHGPQLKDVLFA
jgi:CDP-paratose 2-epimerase